MTKLEDLTVTLQTEVALGIENCTLYMYSYLQSFRGIGEWDLKLPGEIRIKRGIFLSCARDKGPDITLQGRLNLNE